MVSGTLATSRGELAPTGRRVEVPVASLATVDGDRLWPVPGWTRMSARGVGHVAQRIRLLGR